MMKDIKNLLLFNLVVIFLIGCKSLPSFDDVLPDKRTTYKKSKDLPELEIPPDLTVTKGQYSPEIPSDAESTSLNEFERQRSMKNSNEMILGSGNFEDEKWIALAGSSGDIWPKLKDSDQINSCSGINNPFCSKSGKQYINLCHAMKDNVLKSDLIEGSCE